MFHITLELFSSQHFLTYTVVKIKWDTQVEIYVIMKNVCFTCLKQESLKYCGYLVQSCSQQHQSVVMWSKHCISHAAKISGSGKWLITVPGSGSFRCTPQRHTPQAQAPCLKSFLSSGILQSGHLDTGSLGSALSPPKPPIAWMHSPETTWQWVLRFLVNPSKGIKGGDKKQSKGIS